MEIMIDGVNTYYEMYGEGLPIVMLHGWGVDHNILKGCMEPLFDKKNQFKRLYIDLPGMGKTGLNEKIQTSDDVRNYLEKVINSLIPNEKYALVGKSYGGYLARGIVKNNTDRVIGMLQICPVAFFSTHLQNAPKRVVRERESSIKQIVPIEEWEYFDLFHVRQTKEVWEKYEEFILPGTKIANYDFLENVLSKGKEFSINVDTNNSYTFPTLFLCGRQDWCVGYSDLFTLLEQYERASFVVIDNAGHNLEYEQIEMFNTSVLSWINNVLSYTENNRTTSSTSYD